MGLIHSFEARLQAGFASFGRHVPGKCPHVLLASVGGVFLALGFGMFSRVIETDVWKLWVDDSTRLIHEMNYYDEQFTGFRTNSMIVTLQKQADVNLLSVDVFDEILDFTNWFLDHEFPYTTKAGETINVTYKTICLKAIDLYPTDSCHYITPLDMFSEGRVTISGGTGNRVGDTSYDNRRSYKCLLLPEWAKDITFGYVQDVVKYWHNIPYPYYMIAGGVRWAQDHLSEWVPGLVPSDKAEHGGYVMKGARSLRMAMWTLNEKRLAQKGIRTTTWAAPPPQENDVFMCPKAACLVAPLHGTPDDMSPDACNCMECTKDWSATMGIAFGCIPDASLPTQSPTCCEWIAELIAHPCVSVVFATDGTANSIGTFVANQCGYVPPQVYQSVDRCAIIDADMPYRNQPPSSPAAPPTPPAPGPIPASSNSSNASQPAPPGTLPADPAHMCKADALLADVLGPCSGGAGQACCDAARGSIADGSGAATSNCMCVPDVLGGVLALDPSFQSTMDACAADYDVALNYHGQAGNICGGAPDPTASPRRPSSSPVTSAPTPTPCVDPVYAIDPNSVPTITAHPLESEEEAMDVLYGWEQSWLSGLPAKAASYQYIDVSYYSSSSVEDTIKDASNAQVPLIVVGYVLVLIYTIIQFLPFVRKVPPGPIVAALSIVALGLSVWAALGVAGLLCEAGLQFNALTLQVLPFLSLGMGINDYFVLTASLKAVIEDNPTEHDAAVLISKMMAHGGVSVTLSSATNASVLFLAALTPIPALRAFAIHMGIAEVFNYALTLFVFPSLMYYSILKSDISAQGARPAPTHDKRDAMQKFGSSMPGVAVRIVLILVNIVFFAICCVGLDKVVLGLELEDIVPDDKPLYNYAQHTKDYCSYAAWNVIKTIPFEVDYGEARKIDHAFPNTVAHMDVEYGTSNALKWYGQFIEGQVCGGSVCHSEIDYYVDNWMKDQDKCEGKPNEMCQDICTNFCAMVGAPPDKKCKYHKGVDGARDKCFCEYRVIPKPEFFYNISSPDIELKPDPYTTKDQLRIFDKYLWTTTQGGLSQWLTKFEKEHGGDNTRSSGKMTSTRILSFAKDVCSLDKKLEHIRSARSYLDGVFFNQEGYEPGGSDRSPRNVFAFNWVLYALNEQYLHIESATTFVIVISCVVVFCVMLPLIVHPVTSLIATLVLACTEVELWGLIYWSDLKLNAVTMVNLVIAIGFSVEFVAHTGRAFMVSTGTRTERAVAAVAEMGPPLLNGAGSTLMGIIAISFSPYEYFVRYYFLFFLMILIVGLWNGVVLLPVILSFVGPAAFDQAASVAPVGSPETGQDSAPKYDKRSSRSLVHVEPGETKKEDDTGGEPETTTS